MDSKALKHGNCSPVIGGKWWESLVIKIIGATGLFHTAFSESQSELGPDLYNK